MKDKNTSKLKSKLLALESSSFSSFFALASFKNIFFFIFGLLSFLVNSVYLFLIQIYILFNILLTRFFISNDY